VSNKQVTKGLNSGFTGGGESAGGQEEVTKLTISMLLHHLWTSEPTLEAAIAYNLVNFVLVTSEELFIGVARAFSLINVRAAALMYSRCWPPRRGLHAAHAEVQSRV
jgi:hypothetical protein